MREGESAALAKLRVEGETWVTQEAKRRHFYGILGCAERIFAR